VREFGLSQPSTILDKTTELVLESFSTGGNDIQDGMDISLCLIDFHNQSLQWAGANNPLWLIQNEQMIELKPDKQCIGYNEMLQPFTNHTIPFAASTQFYLFTDGYSDQFGGNPERKVTKKRFRELILANQTLPMIEQSNAFNDFFKNYKSDIPQTDDVLVIGVRLLI
jgi:serine phosphatase RsbU (regulator of sigma subunit)